MHELLTQFGVDWKLFTAQVVNFFILLTILRVFAYKPVLAMLHKRRVKIEEGLRASEESKRLLGETKEHERKILLKAEQDALALVSEATDDAKKEEARLLQNAHTKADQVVASGQKRLDEQSAKMQDEITGNARELIKQGMAKIASKVNVDDALIEEALRELKTARS